MKKNFKATLSRYEHKFARQLHKHPSKNTLDHLALFAGFQDWNSLQGQLHEGEDKDAPLFDDEKY